MMKYLFFLAFALMALGYTGLAALKYVFYPNQVHLLPLALAFVIGLVACTLSLVVIKLGPLVSLHFISVSLIFGSTFVMFQKVEPFLNSGVSPIEILITNKGDYPIITTMFPLFNDGHTIELLIEAGESLGYQLFPEIYLYRYRCGDEKINRGIFVPSIKSELTVPRCNNLSPPRPKNGWTLG